MRDQASDPEVGIEARDPEMMLLLRCVQIDGLDQMRMLELLECVLLMMGEGKHHEVCVCVCV